MNGNQYILHFSWEQWTLHLFCLFQVRYKEKYEREKGKPMLDFETPTYVTAKEAQHMQSQVNTLSASTQFKTATYTMTSLSFSLTPLHCLLYINQWCNASCMILICFSLSGVQLLFILELQNVLKNILQCL